MARLLQSAPDQTRPNLQRWLEPGKDGPLPDPKLSPYDNRTQLKVMWEENGKEPKGVYRFKSGEAYWQADKVTQQFKPSDWNVESLWWYDATADLPEKDRWKQGRVPSGYREARRSERPKVTNGAAKKHAYASAADVPIKVRSRYKQKKKGSGSARPVELRALDRIARVLYLALVRQESSPHLATAEVGGTLNVAGNTGPRNVTKDEEGKARLRLRDALDPKKPLPTGTRARHDALKLRAMLTGDYQAAHGEEAGVDLDRLIATASKPITWHSVDLGGESAYHGEMQILDKLLPELEAKPGDPDKPTEKSLGGVKLACELCTLAFAAFNHFVAKPIGYRIVVSGSHGGLYPNWEMPWAVFNNTQAKAWFEGQLPNGWWLGNDGIVHGKADPVAYQNPEDSDSEWEG